MSGEYVLVVATEAEALELGARQYDGVLRDPRGRRVVSAGCHPATLLGIRAVGDIESTEAAREHPQFRLVLSTLERSRRKSRQLFDCMLHDEGIPDAPCNCSDGRSRTGSHPIVKGDTVPAGGRSSGEGSEPPVEQKADVVSAGPPAGSPRRVDQTIFGDDPQRPGNCYAACIASWLGRSLEEVPHFLEYGYEANGPEDRIVWWGMARGYMAAHGYTPVILASLADAEPGEIVFVAGPSPRGILHQVLYLDGELWHDPHPSREGLVEITEVEAWRPVRHDHAPSSEVVG